MLLFAYLYLPKNQECDGDVWSKTVNGILSKTDSKFWKLRKKNVNIDKK